MPFVQEDARPDDTETSLEAYLAEIGRCPLLSREEETELALRYQSSGDAAAAEALITANLRFVVSIAMEYRHCGAPAGDLVQEGNLGLIRAVRTFDPLRGRRLLSYAVLWIRGAIQAFIRKSRLTLPMTCPLEDAPLWCQCAAGAVPAPEGGCRKPDALPAPQKALDKVPGGACGIPLRWEASNGRSAELCAGPDPQPQPRYLSDAPPPESCTTGADCGTGAAEMGAPLPAETPEDTLAQDEFQAQLARDVRRSLDGLSPRDRDILTSRVMADEPVPLRILAGRYGISRERAGQLEARARRLVRRSLLSLRAPRPPRSSSRVPIHAEKHTF